MSTIAKFTLTAAVAVGLTLPVELARSFPAGVATLRIFEDSSHRAWVEEGAVYFTELNAFLDSSGSPAH